jgi:hypothetical protein
MKSPATLFAYKTMMRPTHSAQLPSQREQNTKTQRVDRAKRVQLLFFIR